MTSPQRVYDRARMTTATAGTGTITLGSAVSGFQTFASAGANNADVLRYLIEDGTAWEIGHGTYTSAGTSLTRVLGSSSTGSLLSLSGTAQCSIVAIAEDVTSYRPHCSGRLTLVSGTPRMTGNVSGATSIIWTPYKGNTVPYWNGNRFIYVETPELSNVLANSSTGSAGPAAVVASSVYDMFLWLNAGVPTLTRGPVWTNGTTRSAGTAISQVNGIYVNNISITNGPAAGFGTYVGSFGSDGLATITWSLGGSGNGGVEGILYVWNNYNRLPFTFTSVDTEAQYSYTGGQRVAAGSVGNECVLVVGLPEDSVIATYNARCTSAAALSLYFTGIGFDAGSFSGQNYSVYSNQTAAANGIGGMTTLLYDPLSFGVGAHFVAAIESGDGTNANIFNSLNANRFCVHWWG